jgi:hypothetical protein
MIYVFDELTKKIDEAVAGKSERLLDGIADDYADYRHQTGFIRGLKTAKDIINNLAKAMQENEDE